jgi:hypothetical protein
MTLQCPNESIFAGSPKLHDRRVQLAPSTHHFIRIDADIRKHYPAHFEGRHFELPGAHAVTAR